MAFGNRFKEATELSWGVLMSGVVNSDLHIFALVKQKNGQQKTQNKIVGRVWHLTDF